MGIEVKNLTKIYGEKKVLDNISFKVDDGEILAIVGFSGSGKSTVLKLISNLVEKDEGEIITSEGDIAFVFQYSALFDSLTVYDNIAFALHERKDLKKNYTENEISKIVKEKLELVGLKGIENLYPSELSGGMQKRVSFARAIVTEPEVILYDEPTAGLDPIASTLIEDYILRLRNETHATSIVVTHQMEVVRDSCDYVAVLSEGSVVEQGIVKDIFAQHERCPAYEPHNSAYAEIHQILHNDITCVFRSGKSGFTHCESRLHPEYKRRSYQEPDSVHLAVDIAHQFFHNSSSPSSRLSRMTVNLRYFFHNCLLFSQINI